jgi:hypothetical protein
MPAIISDFATLVNTSAAPLVAYPFGNTLIFQVLEQRQGIFAAGLEGVP